MARKRSDKNMFVTAEANDEIELGPSRTQLRKEQKLLQAKLEALAMELAGLSLKKRRKLELPEHLERAILVLAKAKKGGLARQRRAVAGQLRELDHEDLRERLDDLG